MIFRLEPTGRGITVALPGCGHATFSAREAVSWSVRPAPGEHPRLRNRTELKDVPGRAILTSASASEGWLGRVRWHAAPDEGSGPGEEQYVAELRAPADVFARIAALALEGKPPSLVLEPDGSGKVWDHEVDPQITLRGWRAEVQVTPEQEREATAPPPPLQAQLAEIQKSMASARLAVWAGAIAAAVFLLLALR